MVLSQHILLLHIWEGAIAPRILPYEYEAATCHSHTAAQSVSMGDADKILEGQLVMLISQLQIIKVLDELIMDTGTAIHQEHFAF